VRNKEQVTRKGGRQSPEAACNGPAGKTDESFRQENGAVATAFLEEGYDPLKCCPVVFLFGTSSLTLTDKEKVLR